MVLHEYRLSSSDFCTISFHIHLTHKVQHSSELLLQENQFCFSKRIGKASKLRVCHTRKTKNLKTSSHHITLKALMKEFRIRSHSQCLCASHRSPTAVPRVPPAWYRGAPKSPAINMHCLANIFKHSRTIKKKNYFQECSGKRKVRSEHVEAALPHVKYNKQVLDTARSHGTQCL